MTTTTETTPTKQARWVTLPRLLTWRTNLWSLHAGDRVRTPAGREHELLTDPIRREDQVLVAKTKHTSTGRPTGRVLRLIPREVLATQVRIGGRDRAELARQLTLWGALEASDGLDAHAGIPLSRDPASASHPTLLFQRQSNGRPRMSVRLTDPTRTSPIHSAYRLELGDGEGRDRALLALRFTRDLLTSPTAAMDRLIDLIEDDHAGHDIATSVAATHAGVETAQIDWDLLAPLTHHPGTASFTDLVHATRAATH